MKLFNRSTSLLVLGLFTVLTGCSQVSESEVDQVAEPQPEFVDTDPLVQLAPGVFYYEHDGGVRIKMNYFEFDETSLDAIRAKTAELDKLSAQNLDSLALERSDRWTDELEVAEADMALFDSEAVQTALKAELETRTGELSTLAYGCDNNATARALSSGSGTKAQGKASCNGPFEYETSAETVAEAGGGRPDRDDDEGDTYASAYAEKSGTYACYSSAQAKSKVKIRVVVPAGRDTDRHSGC